MEGVLETLKLLHSFVPQHMGIALASADGHCTMWVKGCEAAGVLWLFAVWQQ